MRVCSTLMRAVKRGWELYESWVTRFGWEFFSTLTRAVKRGGELYESWVARFGWEFCSTLTRAVKRGGGVVWELSDQIWMRVCSTLTRAVKRGWELYESWVTRFAWEFFSTLMRAVYTESRPCPQALRNLSSQSSAQKCIFTVLYFLTLNWISFLFIKAPNQLRSKKLISTQPRISIWYEVATVKNVYCIISSHFYSFADYL